MHIFGNQNPPLIIKPPVNVHIDIDADLANGIIKAIPNNPSIDLFDIANIFLTLAAQCVQQAKQIAHNINKDFAKGGDNGEANGNNNEAGN